MTELKNVYPKIKSGSTMYYGGNQMLSADPGIRKCGCGIVAALDVLLYLTRYGDSSSSDFLSTARSDVIIAEEYDRLLRYLNRHYFHIVPPFGTNGLFLSIGMNLIFRRCGMPYHAAWGVRESRLWDTMNSMLANDIPVVLAVGPNFPRFWRRDNVSFYSVSDDGDYRKSTETRAHFIAVTGIETDWLRISSWGQKLYINRAEFREYVRHSSNNYLSSILKIVHT